MKFQLNSSGCTRKNKAQNSLNKNDYLLDGNFLHNQSKKQSYLNKTILFK